MTYVDVDDTPPVFVNSGCTSTCFTCPISAINANVNYADQVIQKIIICHLRIQSCGSGFADVTIEAIDIKCFCIGKSVQIITNNFQKHEMKYLKIIRYLVIIPNVINNVIFKDQHD